MCCYSMPPLFPFKLSLNMLTVQKYMYAHMYIYIYIDIRIHIYLNTPTHTHICIYAYVVVMYESRLEPKHRWHRVYANPLRSNAPKPPPPPLLHISNKSKGSSGKRDMRCCLQCQWPG